MDPKARDPNIDLQHGNFIKRWPDREQRFRQNQFDTLRLVWIVVKSMNAGDGCSSTSTTCKAICCCKEHCKIHVVTGDDHKSLLFLGDNLKFQMMTEIIDIEPRINLQQQRDSGRQTWKRLTSSFLGPNLMLRDYRRGPGHHGSTMCCPISCPILDGPGCRIPTPGQSGWSALPEYQRKVFKVVSVWHHGVISCQEAG